MEGYKREMEGVRRGNGSGQEANGRIQKRTRRSQEWNWKWPRGKLEGARITMKDVKRRI